MYLIYLIFRKKKMNWKMNWSAWSPSTKIIVILSILVLLAGISVIIWWFGFHSTTIARSTAYLASAARGDFIIVNVGTNNTLSYTNLTNKITGETPFVTDVDGYLSFPNDANLKAALIAPNLGMLIQTVSAGPDKNEKGFALGLIPHAFTSNRLQRTLFNYMQFRTNNGGFEVGYMDSGDTIITRYCSPSQCRFSDDGPGTGDIQEGVQAETDLPIDPSVFALSADSMYLSGGDGEEAATIFQTADGDLVIDLNNGSIFATEAQEDDTAPSGTYSGLLFGRDDATSESNNTETGEEFLTKVKLVFADTTFTWTDDDNVFTGTFVPMHQAVTMGEYQMHGLFYSRITHPESGSLMDFCFIKGKNGKLLCAYYDQALNNSTYSYRHGASFLR